MLFAAKVVERNASGAMLIRVGFVTLTFVLVSMSVPSLSFLAPFFFVTMLLLIIITGIVTRGNLSSYKMENDLYVFDSELQICHLVFPMAEVKELQFSFDSYNGMTSNTNRTGNDSNSFGLGNRLSFRYKKQFFEYDFYVQSQQHYHHFVQMLDMLYIGHINFEERNGKGKTFMMHNVTDEQYQKLKSKYAY
ncbi:MAG: hypothetical protein ABIX01_23990 [Chitinophagaceae bacterium]